MWRRRVDYESVSRTIYKEGRKRNEWRHEGRVLLVLFQLQDSQQYILAYSNNTFPTDDFCDAGSTVSV